MRDAVEAMNRALQQLQTQKTAGAIPHEMAALNALLQAQAEIRKRQVAQQQNNGGGGGGNRQSQDLSNLFDRELKRQQQTNYETKAQVETQPEAPKTDSALDRIRDLARRQEELSRQQRELAKADLSAEEMKRAAREADARAGRAPPPGRGGGAGSCSSKCNGARVRRVLRVLVLRVLEGAQGASRI